MFDLSKFEKISEDKDSTTLRHKDGHEMRILHSYIPKIQKEQLKRLKMAAGGQVNYSSGFNQVQSQGMPSGGGAKGGAPAGQASSSGWDKIGAAGARGIKKMGKPQDAPLEGNAGAGTGGNAEADSAYGGQNGSSDSMQQATPGQQASASDAFDSAIEETLADGGVVEKKEQREKNKVIDGPTGTTDQYHEKGKNTPVGKMNRENDLKKYKQQKSPNIKGLAHGGEVNHYSDESGDESDAVVDSNQQPAAQAQPAVNNITIHAAPAPTPAAPPAPPPNAAVAYADQKPNVQVPEVPNSLPNVDANGQPNPGNIEKNFQTAAQAQKDVDIAKGQAQANTEAGYIQGNKQIQQDAQDKYDNLQTHVNDYKDYINKNPIAADHYFQQNGLGKRLTAAFSIAMGNVGTHGNPALDYINNQLNRDMQSQIENSHNQKNILGAYQDLYGKGVAANAATKATLLDLYTHKAQQTAALLGTPQAKVNAMNFGANAAIEKSKALNDAAIMVNSLPGYKGQGTSGEGQPAQPQAQPSESGASSSGGGGMMPRAQASPMKAPAEKYSGEQDRILSPDAIHQSMGLQKNGLINHDKLQSQLTQADQAEKALMGPNKDGVGGLDEVMTKLDRLAKEGGESGYIRRHNPLNSIPFIGGAAHAIGDAATASDTNKDYDSLKTSLFQDIRTALPGDVSDARVQQILDDNAPERRDEPGLRQKKTDRIRQFIKKSLKTDELEKAHLIPRRKP